MITYLPFWGMLQGGKLLQVWYQYYGSEFSFVCFFFFKVEIASKLIWFLVFFVKPDIVAACCRLLTLCSHCICSIFTVWLLLWMEGYHLLWPFWTTPFQSDHPSWFTWWVHTGLHPGFEKGRPEGHLLPLSDIWSAGIPTGAAHSPFPHPLLCVFLLFTHPALSSCPHTCPLSLPFLCAQQRREGNRQTDGLNPSLLHLPVREQMRGKETRNVTKKGKAAKT